MCPTYDWKCKECGNLFETFQKISAPPPKCNKCNSEVDKQLTSSHKIVFPERTIKDRMT